MKNPMIRRVYNGVESILLYVFALFFIFPLYWMISGSFKNQTYSLKMPPDLIPVHPVWSNYAKLIEQGYIFKWLWNSVAVSSMATAVVCLIATMAGYALTKKQFAGRDFLFAIIVACMLIPRQVTLVPLFTMMRDFDLVNTLTGVILPILSMPISVFLMRQFSQTIPSELLEAGRIDGCSELRLFGNLFLPVVKPGIGALAIFTFSLTWNDYMWQLIMLNQKDRMTVPIGITSLVGEYVQNYGMQMAGATLAFIPVLLVFLIFQKHFVKGITVGSVKG